MKTNDRLLILATAAYSYLFYEQNAGINFLLFNLLFAGALLCRNKNLLKQRNWLVALFLTLISASSIFLHSSVLAILANCFSLMLLSAFALDKKTSFLFSFLFSAYSVISAFIFMVIDASLRSQNQQVSTSKNKGYRLFTIFVVLLLCVLFFVMYQQANPLFAENTKWVNFNFISFSWLAFTAFGFTLVYGLFYHRSIESITLWENNLALNTSEPEELQKTKYSLELSAGVLLFVFLNVMLVILNVGDINTIWFSGVLPKGLTHSAFVHNGVSILILSILIATGLIMFLSRNNFSGLKNSKILKVLIYFWIFQNLLMLFSTAWRNQIYIHDYNLTYKRIGVYVWLILAALGLAFSFIKVLNNRSNWYLIRSNVSLWFCLLALSSVLNWDVLITRYNLKNKAIQEVDLHYLLELSDSNIPELLALTREKRFELVNGKLKNYTSETASRDFNRTYKNLLLNKISHYQANYNPSWQSWDFTDVRIQNALTHN